MSKDIDVLAVGEPLIEFNQRAAGNHSYDIGYGGDTSNCAIAAARLGAVAAYVTRVGDDAFGQRLMALWAAEGVITQGVVVEEGAETGLYFVSHDAAGHHFDYRRRNSAASRLGAADLSQALIARARYLHVSGITQAISASAREAVDQAIGLAQQNGTAVSYDLNFRPRLWSADAALAAAKRTLARCDIFFPGLDEVQTLTGIVGPEAAVAWAHDCGAKVVALKLGAQGCLLSAGGRQERIASVAVNPVDATGAGDCFAGAFLSQLAVGSDPFSAARFANTAAALSTQGYGAVAPIPDRRTVLKRMGSGA